MSVIFERVLLSCAGVEGSSQQTPAVFGQSLFLLWRSPLGAIITLHGNTVVAPDEAIELWGGGGLEWRPSPSHSSFRLLPSNNNMAFLDWLDDWTWRGRPLLVSWQYVRGVGNSRLIILGNSRLISPFSDLGTWGVHVTRNQRRLPGFLIQIDMHTSWCCTCSLNVLYWHETYIAHAVWTYIDTYIDMQFERTLILTRDIDTTRNTNHIINLFPC